MTSDPGARRGGTVAWLIQRITAIIISIGLLAMLAAVIAVGGLNDPRWHQLLPVLGMHWLLGFWLLAVVVHAYLGLEAIYRDYVHSARLRLLAYTASALGLAALWAFGITVFLAWR